MTITKSRLSSIFFLLGIILKGNAQTNIYNTDGTLSANRIMTMSGKNLTFNPSNSNSQFFINGTTGSIGIGTTTPSGMMDVKGIANIQQGFFTASLPDGSTFTNWADRNDKCLLISAGKLLGTGPGYLNTRCFTFYDFPVSNIDPKSIVHFGIEDRNDNGRFRMIAETGGYTQLSMSNKFQQDLMKVFEDGNDNVTLTMPKINSLIGIGTDTPNSKLHVVDGHINITGSSNSNIGFNVTDKEQTTGRSYYGMSRLSNFNVTGETIYNKPGVTLSGYYGLGFYTAGTEVMRVTDWGRVGIGTSTPNEKFEVIGNTKVSGKVGIGGITAFPTNPSYTNYNLFVKGGLLTDEIKVLLSSNGTWADYVFNKNYNLKPLTQVKKYIDINGHLPNMPSEKEIIEDGLNLAKMSKLQQEKIEELTLYLIQQNEQLIQQNKELELLKFQVKALLEKK